MIFERYDRTVDTVLNYEYLVLISSYTRNA